MELIQIKRTDKLTNFTMVPNTAIRSKKLSWKAKGILAYLLSHETGYQLNRQTIVNASEKDGDTVVRGALQELEEQGYLRREQGRAEGEGTFRKSIWMVSAFGDLNQAQEEIPLAEESPDPTPNLELFPKDPAAAKAKAKAKAATAGNAKEFLESVIAEWHAMILAARPVDLFGTQYQPPRVTDKRLRGIRERMKDSDWMRDWKAAINRIGKIPGLHGRVPSSTGQTFECHIDWFLRPDTVARVLEGKYDSWQPRATAAPATAAKKRHTGGF